MSARIGAVERLTVVEASRVLCDGSTVAQLVGHVAAWERFAALAFEEVLNGVRWPGLMRTRGWIGDDGRKMKFNNGDQFSAYIAEQDAEKPWSAIQEFSIRTTQLLQQLLEGPIAASPQVLDEGDLHRWRAAGAALEPMPVGWFLWLQLIWHSGVEHAEDVGLATFDMVGLSVDPAAHSRAGSSSSDGASRLELSLSLTS